MHLPAAEPAAGSQSMDDGEMQSMRIGGKDDPGPARTAAPATSAVAKAGSFNGGRGGDARKSQPLTQISASAANNNKKRTPWGDAVGTQPVYHSHSHFVGSSKNLTRQGSKRAGGMDGVAYFEPKAKGADDDADPQKQAAPKPKENVAQSLLSKLTGEAGAGKQADQSEAPAPPQARPTTSHHKDARTPWGDPVGTQPTHHSRLLALARPKTGQLTRGGSGSQKAGTSYYEPQAKKQAAQQPSAGALKGASNYYEPPKPPAPAPAAKAAPAAKTAPAEEAKPAPVEQAPAPSAESGAKEGEAAGAQPKQAEEKGEAHKEEPKEALLPQVVAAAPQAAAAPPQAAARRPATQQRGARTPWGDEVGTVPTHHHVASQSRLSALSRPKTGQVTRGGNMAYLEPPKRPGPVRQSASWSTKSGAGSNYYLPPKRTESAPVLAPKAAPGAAAAADKPQPQSEGQGGAGAEQSASAASASGADVHAVKPLAHFADEDAAQAPAKDTLRPPSAAKAAPKAAAKAPNPHWQAVRNSVSTRRTPWGDEVGTAPTHHHKVLKPIVQHWQGSRRIGGLPGVAYFEPPRKKEVVEEKKVEVVEAPKEEAAAASPSDKKDASG